jgi:hypothetical protein
MRLSSAMFDPYVAILDHGRFVLAGSDDTPLVFQDAACSAVAPEDGAVDLRQQGEMLLADGKKLQRL